MVGSHGAASPGKSVGLRVHNLAWSAVGADGTLRQSLAAAKNGARLQALVGQPLPSEAESEAVAAKATPTLVPDLPASALAGATASTASVTASPTTTTATAVTATAAPAAPAAPAVPATPPAAEPVKKAAEAVNLLRGLLGR